MKKLSIIFLALFSATFTVATGLDYDRILITPQTWEEVDLTYTNTIDGKEYTEYANLLRPIDWIKHKHLDKIGTTIHLTEETLGIDVDAIIIAIKSTKFIYGNNSHESIKPVIATFISHSKDVWDYAVNRHLMTSSRIRI